MKTYRVTFIFENRTLHFDNPVNEEGKKAIEKAFMKKRCLDIKVAIINLSKCLWVKFEEVN